MRSSPRRRRPWFLLAIAGFAVACSAAQAAPRARKPWMNTALDADRRAELVLAQMSQAEKQTLVFGYFATDAPWKKYVAPAEARPGSAGYVPGIPRLGIPPQWETDAGIGVATQGGAKDKRARTALPSGLATAASWDPDLARRAGAMIGAEARASGFNVMLAGGVNLVREPRNGRNFEYGGEDPLLAGVIVGAQIAGIESNHVISTIKHFALNDQETDRNTVDVLIDRDQARMSDLLAFQIAIEQANPGAVMCSYNTVWGEHACESSYLLTDLLRRDWAWRGYVMSDWGAVYSTAKAARSGLDQESGYPFDQKPFFRELLLDAGKAGEVPEARLNEMAKRILRTMFAKGVIDHPVESAPLDLPAKDLEAHAVVSREGAEQGAVLLKNEGDLLPLRADLARIAVIGGHADKGVLAGGGSSLVYPVGGNAVLDLDPDLLARAGHGSPVVAPARHQNAGAKGPGAIRQRGGSRRGGSPGRAERRRHRVRDVVGRRILRRVAHAAGRTGRAGERSCQSEPTRHRGARDRRRRVHAVDQPGSRRRPGLVSGHERRRRHRQPAVRPGQPFRPAAHQLSEGRQPARPIGSGRRPMPRVKRPARSATRKARRPDTSGTTPRSCRPCSRSGSGSRTRASSTRACPPGWTVRSWS